MAGSAPRVRLVEREDVPPEDLAAYDHVAEVRAGRMGNVFKALANNPGLLERVAAVGEVLRGGTSLRRGLQELVILTVAHETRCMYEWASHFRIVEEFAERLRISPETMTKIGTPDLEREPAPAGPAARYARQVVRGEPVDDATIAVLKEHLGDRGLVELTVLAGYYTLLSRFVETLHVPLDPEEKVRPWPEQE